MKEWIRKWRRNGVRRVKEIKGNGRECRKVKGRSVRNEGGRQLEGMGEKMKEKWNTRSERSEWEWE